MKGGFCRLVLRDRRGHRRRRRRRRGIRRLGRGRGVSWMRLVAKSRFDCSGTLWRGSMLLMLSLS
jgi:hypothetical protein